MIAVETAALRAIVLDESEAEACIAILDPEADQAFPKPATRGAAARVPCIKMKSSCDKDSAAWVGRKYIRHYPNVRLQKSV